MTTIQKLNQLYQGSACTMLGYMPDELHLYTDELKENGFLKEDFTVYEFKGKDLNETFELTDKFNDDLNVFIIDLEDMKDIGRFAVTLRFERGYRWLDDIVNNSRQEEYVPKAEVVTVMSKGDN